MKREKGKPHKQRHLLKNWKQKNRRKERKTLTRKEEKKKKNKPVVNDIILIEQSPLFYLSFLQCNTKRRIIKKKGPSIGKIDE